MVTLLTLLMMHMPNNGTYPPSPPGLPIPPPFADRQVTKDDGTRLTCTPEFQWCWEES